MVESASTNYYNGKYLTPYVKEKERHLKIIITNRSLR